MFPPPVPVVETPAGGVVVSSYLVCVVTRSMASSARAVDVSQDSGADSVAHGSSHDEPAEMGACKPPQLLLYVEDYTNQWMMWN